MKPLRKQWHLFHDQQQPYLFFWPWPNTACFQQCNSQFLFQQHSFTNSLPSSVTVSLVLFSPEIAWARSLEASAAELPPLWRMLHPGWDEYKTQCLQQAPSCMLATAMGPVLRQQRFGGWAWGEDDFFSMKAQGLGFQSPCHSGQSRIWVIRHRVEGCLMWKQGRAAIALPWSRWSQTYTSIAYLILPCSVEGF